MFLITLRHKLLIALCCLVTFAVTSSAQCPPAVHVGIDSVITAESRCQATGVATVYASQGAAPYTYTIISGPVTAPAQSTSIFQSLSPGSYTVQVTDNCNQSATSNFTITGNYSVPSPAETLQPPRCQNGNDGQITITVTNGRGPFSYSLISPSPVTAGPQASNVFSGLSAGNYTYRVTDSCGNFQTRTVTLPGGSNGDFYIGTPTLKWLACDSFRVSVILFPNPSQRIPYTLILKKQNGDSIIHVLDSSALGGPGYTGFVLDTFYVHIPVKQSYTLTATSACGITHTSVFQVYKNPYMFNFTLDGCNGYKYGNYGTDATTLCPTATYTLEDPSGNVLSTALASSFPTYSGYPPGSGYKLIINDCCLSDSVTFTWATPPTLAVTGIQVEKSCKINQAAVLINFGNVSSPVNLIFTSGPASTTFSDGTTKYYHYPDTLFNYVQGTNYPYALDRISYLTTGTYTIRATDTCGHIADTSFTVTAGDVRSAAFSTATKRSCTNGEILYTGTDNDTYARWSNLMSYITISDPAHTDPYYTGNYFNTINAAAYPATSTSFTDSVINLQAGTYYVHYHTSTNLVNNGTLQPWLPDDNSHYGGGDTLQGIGFQTCDILTDTVVVPAYANPFFTTPAALAVCNTNHNVAILPDTTTGMTPYQYQITAGPVTTSLQSSPVFPNLPAGTYTFQMSDACGNSYSNSISIDTLIMPGIVTTGSTCQGGTAVFTAPANPYYSYTWRRPNGTTDSSNAITISPVSTADTGIYHVTVLSTINGCSDSTAKSLRLAFCTTLPLQLISFEGSASNCNVNLEWQTGNEKDFSYFDVEYSVDSRSFSKISSVQGNQNANGSTYHYTYTQPAGNSYYRLKMIATDQSATYSNTIAVSCRDQQPVLQVYPNPANDELHIEITSLTKNETASCTLTDLSGRTLMQEQLQTGTDNLLKIQSLAPGMYLLHIHTDAKSWTQKFIKSPTR